MALPRKTSGRREASSERLRQLALPNCHLVEAVLKEHYHIFNKDCRDRLKNLLEVILTVNGERGRFEHLDDDMKRQCIKSLKLRLLSLEKAHRKKEELFKKVVPVRPNSQRRNQDERKNVRCSSAGCGDRRTGSKERRMPGWVGRDETKAPGGDRKDASKERRVPGVENKVEPKETRMLGVESKVEPKETRMPGADRKDEVKKISMPGAAHKDDVRKIWMPGADHKDDVRKVWMPGGDHKDDVRKVWMPGGDHKDEVKNIWMPTADHKDEAKKMRMPGADHKDDVRKIWMPTADHKDEAKKTWMPEADHKDEAKKTWMPGADHKDEAKKTWMPGADHKDEAKKTWMPGGDHKDEAKKTRMPGADQKEQVKNMRKSEEVHKINDPKVLFFNAEKNRPASAPRATRPGNGDCRTDTEKARSKLLMFKKLLDAEPVSGQTIDTVVSDFLDYPALPALKAPESKPASAERKNRTDDIDKLFAKYKTNAAEIERRRALDAKGDYTTKAKGDCTATKAKGDCTATKTKPDCTATKAKVSSTIGDLSAERRKSVAAVVEDKRTPPKVERKRSVHSKGQFLTNECKSMLGPDWRSIAGSECRLSLGSKGDTAKEESKKSLFVNDREKASGCRRSLDSAEDERRNSIYRGDAGENKSERRRSFDLKVGTTEEQSGKNISRKGNGEKIEQSLPSRIVSPAEEECRKDAGEKANERRPKSESTTRSSDPKGDTTTRSSNPKCDTTTRSSDPKGVTTSRPLVPKSYTTGQPLHPAEETTRKNDAARGGDEEQASEHTPRRPLDPNGGNTAEEPRKEDDEEKAKRYARELKWLLDPQGDCSTDEYMRLMLENILRKQEKVNQEEVEKSSDASKKRKKKKRVAFKVPSEVKHDVAKKQNDLPALAVKYYVALIMDMQRNTNLYESFLKIALSPTEPYVQTYIKDACNRWIDYFRYNRETLDTLHPYIKELVRRVAMYRPGHPRLLAYETKLPKILISAVKSIRPWRRALKETVDACTRFAEPRNIEWPKGHEVYVRHMNKLAALRSTATTSGLPSRVRAPKPSSTAETGPGSTNFPKF